MGFIILVVIHLNYRLLLISYTSLFQLLGQRPASSSLLSFLSAGSSRLSGRDKKERGEKKGTVRYIGQILSIL
jgi:hypothetical protein